jgi:hypothetical protein
MSTITDRLLDRLTRQRLGEYFATMKLKMRRHNYAYLCTEMLRTVKQKAAEPRAVSKFVIAVVSDRELQTLILARLEYLDEALVIAEKDKNKQTIGEIKDITERNRNTKIASKCQKQLGK